MSTKVLHRASFLFLLAVLSTVPAWAQITAGNSHSCTVNVEGAVRCWGNNTVGQLGDSQTCGTVSCSAPSIDVGEFTNVVRAVAGRAHTCSLHFGGGVICWGTNVAGQVGVGSDPACGGDPANAFCQPRAVCADPGCVQRLSDVLESEGSLAAGDDHTCAVSDSGTVRCWGRNLNGQLGNGTTVNAVTATHVLSSGSPLTGISRVAAGIGHTCALSEANTVSCWGDNSLGQLGDDQFCGSTCTSPTPVCGDASCSTNLNDVVDIALGGRHACALTDAGTVKCWGDNSFGQLGDGTTIGATTPVDVLESELGPPLSGVEKIVAGRNHTCALTAATEVVCWGRNISGQLGDGTDENRTIPVKVVSSLGGASLTSVTELAAGGAHTCAMSGECEAQCWGLNNNGQLGTGSTVNSAVPATVTSFCPSIGEYWAPTIYQDTDDSCRAADLISRFNYDGNFDSKDNWNNLADDSCVLKPASLPAEVYSWSVETETHWYLGYTLFHARDWGEECNALSDFFGPLEPVEGLCGFVGEEPVECTEDHGDPDVLLNCGLCAPCVFGFCPPGAGALCEANCILDQAKGIACHENDAEGVLLIVQKDGTRYGSFLAMVARLHEYFEWYKDSHQAPSATLTCLGCEPSEPECCFRGDVEFDGHRPIIYAEAKGHAIRGAERWESEEGFPGGDGVIYKFAGTPKDQRTADLDQPVGYGLLSIQELWIRRCEIGANAPFSQFGQYGGDDWGDNKTKPPWGWEGFAGYSDRTKLFLDPANALADPIGGATVPALSHPISTVYTSATYLSPGPGSIPPVCSFDEMTTEDLDAGQSITSDAEGDGATGTDPLETSIAVPASGSVAITEGELTSGIGSGFRLLGQEARIVTSPDPLGAPGNPLRIAFRIDESALEGNDELSVEVFKDGGPPGGIPGCVGTPGMANPDPCVSARARFADGDIEIVVLSSDASTWGFAGPARDTVLSSTAPINLKIREGHAEVRSSLKVKVRSAAGNPSGAESDLVQLVVSDGSCPPGTVTGSADFDLDTPGPQNSIGLGEGSLKTATVPLNVLASSVSGTKLAPFRCALNLLALSTEAANSDPELSNNFFPVEITISDDNDTQQSAVHETFVKSLKPLKAVIGAGKPRKVTRSKPAPGNSDILPAPEDPGDLITVTAADGDCPAGTVGVADYNKDMPGQQNTVTVPGGKIASGNLPVTVNATGFATTNKKSPTRCTAVVTVTGPGGDTDASNNTTRLVIDVYDKNDF